MFKEMLRADPAMTELAGPLESSRWTVAPAQSRHGASLTPAALPTGPGLRDDYPLIQPGTPAAVTASEALAVAERPAPEALPCPTPRRRRERRYEVSEDRIWIQWWADGEFNGLSGRLINVSRHGALIVVAAQLSEHQALRVTLEDPEQTPGVDALVLGSVEGSMGLNKVRLGFLGPCPDAFFAAVADGFEAWLAGKRWR